MSARPCEACDASDFRRIGEKVGHVFVKCAACGMERIDPPPTDEVLSRVYGEHYYDSWGLKANEDEVSRLKRATFERVVRGAGDLPRGAKILDCGAATGFLMEVAREAGYDAYGVELSEFGAGAIAAKFGKDHVFQGEIEQASFAGLGGGDGAFQAVFMCDYIEHVRDPLAVLRRVRALLAPGGTLCITTPRLDSLTHGAMGMGWTHYKVEHLYYFNSASLERLLAKAGFGSYRGASLWKTMTLKYMTHQFRIYPHALLTGVVNATMKVLPRSLQAAPFPIRMGELLAYATRN